MSILGKYISPITNLLASQPLERIVKMSPLLLVPIFLYLLGSQYIDALQDFKVKEAQNKQLELLLNGSQYSKKVISEYILRNHYDFDDKQLTNFLALVNHFNNNQEEYKRESINKAYDFLYQTQNLFSESIQSNIATLYFVNLAKQEVLDTYLLSFLINQSTTEEEDYTKKIVTLLEAMSLENVFDNQAYKIKIYPTIQQFFAYKRISKNRQNKIIQP